MTIKILAPNDPALQAYVATLEAESHDIQLDIVPFAEYRARLDKTLEADTSPYQVVFVPGHLWIPELAAANKITPLESYFEQQADAYIAYQPDTLLPIATNEAEYNGKSYMIPLFSDGHILFYDPQRVPLNANTIAPRDMLELCAYSQAGDGQHVIALKAHPSEIFLDFLPYLLDINGNILDENNRPTFNTDAGRAALKLYLELAQYAPTHTADYDNEGIADALRTGAVSMAVTWGGQAAPIFLNSDSVAASTYQSAVFTTPWNATWGAAIASNQSDEAKADAVAALLKLHTPKLDERVLIYAGSPIRSISYNGQNMNQYPWLAAQKQMLDRAILLPKLPEIGQVLGALYGNVFAALRNEKSIDAALRDAETAILNTLG